MGFFKAVFGGDKSSSSPRSIDSPKALAVGDIMKMEFSDQSIISAQTLKVTEQVFYDISAVENCKTVSVMEGVGRRIYISWSSVNPDRPLEVAISVLPETVFEVFNEGEFTAIFDEPDDTDHQLSRVEGELSGSTQDLIQGFVGDSYYQERTNEAYRSTKDCRKSDLKESDWSGFDYKLMVTDDRQYAVRIEVYDGGRTDVYLIVYLPLNKVEEYWPASDS